MNEAKDWSAMMAKSAALLEGRTGAGIAGWNERVRASGADQDEGTLRAWLATQGVTGYAQQLLIMERFGYPDFLTATADELINAQYADRLHLRPILDRVVALSTSRGQVSVQARKGYVSLVGPRRTFAVVRPTTKRRVDLGLRLAGASPSGRLQPARGLGNETITVRVALCSLEDVDEEVGSLLQRAYESNV